MKALPINVYRDAQAGDCTNGGISSRYDELLLLCESGYIEINEKNPPENLVKIVTRKVFGREHKHIEPVASHSPGCVGWMYGGNIASSSDGRFNELSEYPLHIHDRQEIYKQYDALR